MKIRTQLSAPALTFALIAALTTPTIAGDRVFKVTMPYDFVSESLNAASEPKAGYSSRFSIGDCPDINDPILAGTDRGMVELLFVCHAVRDAGAADTIELVSFPNPKRGLLMLISGEVDAFGSSKFLADGDRHIEELLISDPVLTRTQFPVGIFTAENRQDVLQADSVEDILAMRGISVEHHPLDIQTMRNLPMAEVVTAPVYETIGPMLANNRADITFQSLAIESVELSGTRLVRMDGFVAYLDAPRVMMFSKRHPDVFEAMQSFIKRNRAMPVDRITEAYYLSGFLNRAFSDWQNLGGGGS